MRLRFREGVQRQKRFKELFVCACRCCKTAALCLCRAEVKLIISLFRSPLGPYWVGKTQDAANCFLPTCINVDADWDAELWLLESPNWNAAFRSPVPHPTCIFSFVSEESSLLLPNWFFIFPDLFPRNLESMNILQKHYQESKGFGRFVCLIFFCCGSQSEYFWPLNAIQWWKKQDISQPAEKLPPDTASSHGKLFLH